MANYDVFNGDADGVISLVQLRLNEPKQSYLITGVKRDIALLQQVRADHGDDITVLDISMEKNADALTEVLDMGAYVTYIDHHRAGHIPHHSSLKAHINLDANMCTALIVDELIEGKYHAWAIAAAYGDNLVAKADEIANQAGYTNEQKAFLKELGTLVNYNGYGSSINDLHYHPADLYQALVKYESPFELQSDSSSVYHALRAAYQNDFDQLDEITPLVSNHTLGAFVLPNEPWARRVIGVFSNDLANEMPHRAHAVCRDNGDGTYTVSLRAPLNNKQGAGDVCAMFPTGGGRAAAGGVNALPEHQLDEFMRCVERYYAS